jgi:hypothetical protein
MASTRVENLHYHYLKSSCNSLYTLTNYFIIGKLSKLISLTWKLDTYFDFYLVWMYQSTRLVYKTR